MRYALAAAGVAWTENSLRAPGDVDRVRGGCLFNQVPRLDIGGEHVVQSWTIVRHVGATYGPAPPAAAAWRADAAAEEVRDFFVAADLVGYGWAAEAAAPAARAAVEAAARERVAAAAARTFAKFDRVLAAAGGFVTGAAACWADYQLLYALDYAVDVCGAAVLAPHAPCAALHAALRAEPRMADFYATRAKPLVTPTYIAEVRAAQLPA